MMHRIGVLLAAGVLQAAALFATAGLAAAQEQSCAGVFQNSSREFARGPEAKRIQRQVRQKAPVAWSAAVAAQCPRLDPIWLRAKQRKINCGYFSSS